MDFASIVWWAYLITALAGLGFGVLQCILLKYAVFAQPPRRWMYAIKFGLWALALVVMALVSLPLLVVFAVAASITLLVGSAWLYIKAQREAR